MKRNATESYVARSSLRLENTPSCSRKPTGPTITLDDSRPTRCHDSSLPLPTGPTRRSPRRQAARDAAREAIQRATAEASSWYGVGVPKATPSEIIEKLNKEINAALADPRFGRQIAQLGSMA